MTTFREFAENIAVAAYRKGYFSKGTEPHETAASTLDYFMSRVPEFVSLSEYVKDVRRTFGPQENQMNNAREFLAMVSMGLAGEAGEVSELVKKHLFHDRRDIRERVKEELGDTLRYLVALTLSLGFTVEEVMQANTEKCLKRYPLSSSGDQGKQ